MRSKIFALLTSLLIGLSLTASGVAMAGPDLPKPPKPSDLPKLGDLPGIDDDSSWWDPLGLFSDDDDDHRKEKHGKHKDKHQKHKKKDH